MPSFFSAIEERVGDVQEWRGTDDITCVLEMLNARISDGEIADVKANLPKRIRDLWPD